MLLNRKKTRYISAAILFAMFVVIFYFSSQPGSASADTSGSITAKFIKPLLEFFGVDISSPQVFLKVDSVVRKLAHFTEYAALGFCAAVFSATYFTKSTKKFFLPLAVCFLYAGSDEIHQLFVAQRSGQIVDVLVDTLGAAFGVSILIIAERIINKIIKKKHKTTTQKAR